LGVELVGQCRNQRRSKAGRSLASVPDSRPTPLSATVSFQSALAFSNVTRMRADWRDFGNAYLIAFMISSVTPDHAIAS
jgi:hypothetical protein